MAIQNLQDLQTLLIKIQTHIDEGQALRADVSAAIQTLQDGNASIALVLSQTSTQVNAMLNQIITQLQAILPKTP